MKKLLSIIVLSVLLLGMVGGTALAAPGDDCCNASDCDTGETCSVSLAAGCAPADEGTCSVGASGAPNTLKEFCTLNSQVVWKSGTIGDDDCTADDPCTLGDGETVGPKTDTAVDHPTDQWGMVCLINTVNNATNWIFYLLMVIVVVMIVIGGATYMLAAGNPERAGKGKTIIIYGIVGLVIALLARLIPSVVKLIVGM